MCPLRLIRTLFFWLFLNKIKITNIIYLLYKYSIVQKFGSGWFSPERKKKTFIEKFLYRSHVCSFDKLLNYQIMYSSIDSPNYLPLILFNYFSLCESWLTSIFRSMDSSVASVPNHENITCCRPSPIMQTLVAFRFTGFLVQLSLLPTWGAGHKCGSSLLFAGFIHLTLELCRLVALSMMTCKLM